MLDFSAIDKLKYYSVKLFLMLLNLFTFFLFSGSIRRYIRKYKESIYLSKLMKCNFNNWHEVLIPGMSTNGSRVKYKTSTGSPYSLYYTKPDTFILSYRGERVLLFSKHFKNDSRTKTILSILKDKTN